MKVALVLDRFDPDAGGLERWARELARWLVRNGEELHVVAAEGRRSGAGDGSTPLAGAAFHRIPPAPSRLGRAAAAARLVGRLGADVVHDLGTGTAFDVFQPQFGSRVADFRQSRRAAGSAPGAARSVRDRGSYLMRRLLERRQLAVRGALVVAVSRMTAAHFRDLHGVDAARIRIVPNGADVDRFSPERLAAERGAARERLGARPGDVVVLAAGHNRTLKGASEALGAFATGLPSAAGRPGARFVLLGRGDPAPLRERAAALGVAGRCSFPGFVPDVVPFFAAADLFLHPTYYDPCSLVVLEALASALPVVTTRSDGASELMTDRVHGRVVDDPADAARLAAALAEVADARFRSPAASAARDLARALSLESNFRRVAEVHAEAVERRAAAERGAA